MKAWIDDSTWSVRSRWASTRARGVISPRRRACDAWAIVQAQRGDLSDITFRYPVAGSHTTIRRMERSHGDRSSGSEKQAAAIVPPRSLPSGMQPPREPILAGQGLSCLRREGRLMQGDRMAVSSAAMKRQSDVSSPTGRRVEPSRRKELMRQPTLLLWRDRFSAARWRAACPSILAGSRDTTAKPPRATGFAGNHPAKVRIAEGVSGQGSDMRRAQVAGQSAFRAVGEGSIHPACGRVQSAAFPQIPEPVHSGSEKIRYVLPRPQLSTAGVAEAGKDFDLKVGRRPRRKRAVLGSS